MSTRAHPSVESITYMCTMKRTKRTLKRTIGINGVTVQFLALMVLR
jgi:hypothetical protein